MDRESYVLPGILIVILIVILVLVVAFSGDKTFNMGQVSFQYPAGWSESSTTGNFSNTSLYSEVTLTYDVIDSSGSTQTAYIIVQMQQKAKGVLNLPGTSSIIANNTNSSISSVNVDNFTATQLGSAGDNMVQRVTLVEYNDYYYVISMISPISGANQTIEAYNMILKTFRIS